MRDIERRRLDALKRCVQFYTDNQTALATGVVNTKFLALTAAVNTADSRSATVESQAGLGKGSTEQKSTIRENLRDRCAAISATAKGMEPDFDGISATFRFQRNLNDADLLARAMGFAQSAIAFEADFISYNLPATFLADLNAEIAAFEAAVNAQSSNIGDRIEAHAELSNAISEGLILKRTLDPLVRNIFASDSGKIAAWASAAHVEKAPEKKKDAAPVPEV